MLPCFYIFHPDINHLFSLFIVILVLEMCKCLCTWIYGIQKKVLCVKHRRNKSSSSLQIENIWEFFLFRFQFYIHIQVRGPQWQSVMDVHIIMQQTLVEQNHFCIVPYFWNVLNFLHVYIIKDKKSPVNITHFTFSFFFIFPKNIIQHSVRVHLRKFFKRKCFICIPNLPI